MRIRHAIAVAVFAGTIGPASAAPIDIVNSSFEDDPNNANEFFFGTPTGWDRLDPGLIIPTDAPGPGTDVDGTLTVTGSAYFGGAAPNGDNVAILFIGEQEGTTELGIGQVLSAGLEAHTRYELLVEVGNIDSGPTQAFGFFDLRGFPGYRIELLAGGVLLSSVVGGIDAPIAEGAFETVSLEYVTGAAPAQIGEALEVRLFNLNLQDASIPDDPVTGPPDLEVDFDNVRLNATSAPEPATTALLGLGLASVLAFGRRRRQPSIQG